jgi:hypothetical protein
MRTPRVAPLSAPATPMVPLLDTSFLPDDDWNVLDGLNAGFDMDPDEDRFAGLGLSAGDLD